MPLVEDLHKYEKGLNAPDYVKQERKLLAHSLITTILSYRLSQIEYGVVATEAGQDAEKWANNITSSRLSLDAFICKKVDSINKHVLLESWLLKPSEPSHDSAKRTLADTLNRMAEFIEHEMPLTKWLHAHNSPSLYGSPAIGPYPLRRDPLEMRQVIFPVFQTPSGSSYCLTVSYRENINKLVQGKTVLVIEPSVANATPAPCHGVDLYSSFDPLQELDMDGEDEEDTCDLSTSCSITIPSKRPETFSSPTIARSQPIAMKRSPGSSPVEEEGDPLSYNSPSKPKGRASRIPPVSEIEPEEDYLSTSPRSSLLSGDYLPASSSFKSMSSGFFSPPSGSAGSPKTSSPLSETISSFSLTKTTNTLPFSSIPPASSAPSSTSGFSQFASPPKSPSVSSSSFSSKALVFSPPRPQFFSSFGSKFLSGRGEGGSSAQDDKESEVEEDDGYGMSNLRHLLQMGLCLNINSGLHMRHSSHDVCFSNNEQDAFGSTNSSANDVLSRSYSSGNASLVHSDSSSAASYLLSPPLPMSPIRRSAEHALLSPPRPSPLSLRSSSSSSSSPFSPSHSVTLSGLRVGGRAPKGGTPVPPRRTASSAIGQNTEEDDAQSPSSRKSTPISVGSGSGSGSRSRSNSLYSSSPSESFISSFAGSFQESILSGRMSNVPCTIFKGFSVDLVATYKTKSSAHLRQTFDTYYYHLDASSHAPNSIPYVGTIDLPAKGFRIPSRGLFQVTIFNPSKTGIKTLLVRYDVHDMPPDTKTFLRQTIRSRSRPSILHYAVQFRIASPQKKKYYLMKNIRLVFAHRTPDDCDFQIDYDFPDNPKYVPL